MNFKQGSTYSGFSLKAKNHIQEIGSEVYLFEHQILCCPLLAIKNNDPNKTFVAAFNTIPEDSTGVAHILEHSVLMGSVKYPVKDVFGEINKGGLTTFLNAMTGADITYYPFATRNLKEYFNIMDVYCDVVFNPLLERSTFEQEGWHYHQEGPGQPLQYQGVVYNEMKGAFSDPVRYLFHHIFSGLMPNSTYAHESGGDPSNIPDLSYEEFCSFHSRHYHPSNGMFFVYGDADLADELEFLQSRFLGTYSEAGSRSEIAEGTTPGEPVRITDSYAVDSSDVSNKTFLAVGTNVATIAQREENTAFQVIANILYNSDGSPLKNAITSSGLCKDFGGLYLSTSSFRTMMVTYLVGSEERHREEFLDLYSTTLEKMVEEGLEKDLVLSELNKYEFSAREDLSKAQRGLDLIGRAMTGLKYGTDPFDCLENDALLKSIREKALGEGYFETLIRQHLLNNPSTVIVTLVPDPAKQAARQAAERDRLDRYDKEVTPAERESRIERTKELMELQRQPNSIDTLSLLPQLSLDDLSTDIEYHSCHPRRLFGREVLINELPTNQISYIDAGFNLQGVKPELLPLMDIFGTIVTEIGTKRLNFQAFAKELATCTGGLSHSLTSYTKRKEQGRTNPVLWFHLKCLADYQERALQLLGEVFSSLSLDDKRRIRDIVGREFAWAEHSVHSEGYTLPSTRIFAQLSLAGKYNEMFNGVTAYLALKELVTDYDRREDEFLRSMKQIARSVFNRNNLLLSITADSRELAQFERQGSSLVEALLDEPVSRYDIPDFELPRHEAFITAAEVVFAAQGATLLPRGEGYNGHFEVLKTYLSRDYLWNTVRQMGGAYGCFIQFSQISGNIVFVSYRDPQVKKTYDAYDAIPAIVADIDLPGRTLEQLIIGTYGNFNPLQSVASKGATARNNYLNGIDSEYRRQKVREITSTTNEDLRGFADAFTAMAPQSHRSIIGNRAKIEADSSLFSRITAL